jgi:transcription elongation factor Elf1
MVIKTTYMCPKCGSTNWNSLNTNFLFIEKSKHFLKCNECDYIGIFLDVDIDMVEKVRKEINNNKCCD